MEGISPFLTPLSINLSCIFAVREYVFRQSLDISVLFQMHVSIVTVYSIFCLDSCVNKLLHLKICLYFSEKKIPLHTAC